MKKTSSFVWNMIGSSCYSISSILYLMVVTRVCGAEEAGFFSLAYATAQLLLTIGRFGMRTFQSTDLNSQYSFYEYLVSRSISVALMLILGVGYSLISFSGTFIAISFLVIAMKSIDAIEDVFHGRMQQAHHIEQMGKSQFLRNFYTAVCFAAVLAVTKQLLLTLCITVLSSLVLCLVINFLFIKKLALVTETEKRIGLRAVFSLLRSCFGIFFGTFLSLLLYNIPKYAMEGMLSAEYQTYYSILFMPSFVVTLLCEFVFRPTITGMAESWFAGSKKRFYRSVISNLGLIAGASVVVTLAGHYIGRYLLELLYDVDLSPYKIHFVVLLLGGGVGACVYMIYNILIAIRHGGSIKIVYAVTTAASICVVRPLVSRYGMMGAALNYLFAELMLLIIFSAILLYVFRKNNRPS